MGADRAIHVDIPAKDYETLEPFHVSKILAQLAADEKVDVVIVGKQVNNNLMYFCHVFNILLQQDWYKGTKLLFSFHFMLYPRYKVLKMALELLIVWVG